MKFITSSMEQCAPYSELMLDQCIFVPHKSKHYLDITTALENLTDDANGVISIINKMQDDEITKLLDTKTDLPITYDNYKRLLGLTKRVSAYYTTVANSLITKMNNLTIKDYQKGGAFGKLCAEIRYLDKLFTAVQFEKNHRRTRFHQKEVKKHSFILPVKFKDEFAKLWFTGENPISLKELGVDSKQKLIECVKVYIDKLHLLNEQSNLYKKINDDKVAKVYIEAMSEDWEDEGYDSKDEYIEDLEYGIRHHSVLGSDMDDDYGIQEFQKLIGIVGGEDTYAVFCVDMYQFCDNMIKAIINKLTPSK